MILDRRNFLAGVASLAFAPVLPAQAEGGRFIRVYAPRFSQAMAQDVAADWLELCAYHSAWHYDGDYPDGMAFIRHRMTRLTYHLTTDEDGGICATQVSTECCPANEAADPDYIVGHAARRVASHVLPFHRDAHARCFFIAFEPLAEEPWRRPILTAAPPIPIIPLDRPAAPQA